MATGDTVLALFTVAQPDVILKWVSLALTIITTLLTAAFTIYKWWKKAKQDGKIDEKEQQELIDILENTKDKLNGKDKED